MRFALAGFAACAALSACFSAPEPSQSAGVDLRALSWVSAEADIVAHLTEHPDNCLPAELSGTVRRGELLFNSPFLLGGQAAKAGLSCGSCHRNGRGNPDFVFAGISGAPGTADVTHAFFGPMRADRDINPVPIPDLASPAGHRLVERDSPGALEQFLEAQIVEEFSGQTPNDRVVADLAAYIRAIDAHHCTDGGYAPQSWTDEWSRVEAGIAANETLPLQHSPPYLQAARAALGRLYERYPAADHARVREALISLSLAIRDQEGGLNEPQRLTAVRRLLEQASPTSLYDAETLGNHLR